MTIDLDNKTFLIAGAAGKIGSAIVSGALKCGANVVAVDKDFVGLSKLEKNLRGYGRLSCAEIDISSSESLLNVLKSSHSQFGMVDGAVNTTYPRNANYGRSFFDVSYSDFCENVSLHLGGYFLFMQECARYSAEVGKKFSLVHLSSIYGFVTPRFDIYAGTSMTMPVEYAAIKSALLQLTRYVNSYMKGQFFRANSVSPGGVFADQDDSFLKNYKRYCMTKGILNPEDIVGTILYLLSDASEFVVGQNIVVDDGFSL